MRDLPRSDLGAGAGMLAALIVVAPFAPTGATLTALALAGSLGALGGLVSSLACSALGCLPERSRSPTALLVGGVLGYQLVAAPLGVWSRLQGEHRVLALGTLLASTLLGALALGLVWWTRPAPAAQRRAERPGPRVRIALGGVGLVVALGVAAFEASQAHLAHYPVVQRALAFGAWLLAFASNQWLLAGLPGTERARRPVVVGALGVQAAFGLALWLADARATTLLVKGEHTQHWVWLARTLSDWDRDGASAHLGGGDCSPFDARVAPGRAEIRGNGIDDNCRFGDAPPRPIQPPLPSAPSASGVGHRPNLVLITVDTLRADRTTPYGHGRDTTPNLRAFAERSLLFENAYTSGGWTCLALPSLFGGVYPRRLEWKPAAVTTRYRVVDFPWQEQLAPGEGFLLSVTVPKTRPAWWLPSELQRHGYRTLALLNRAIRELSLHIVNHGWDEVLMPDVESDAALAELVLQKLRGEQTRPNSAPLFVWVHLFEPHEPQVEHSGVASFGASLSDKYDHEVLAMDAALGRVLGGLDAAFGDDVAIVFGADHGEALHEGRQFHGLDLLEDGIRIPLLLRAPGVQPLRVNTAASLVDIVPTFLELAGIAVPPGLDGVDLRSLAAPASQGAERRAKRGVITDLFRVNDTGQPLIDMVAVTTPEERLIRDNLKQVEWRMRTGDLGRPPEQLEPSAADAASVETLAQYAESASAL